MPSKAAISDGSFQKTHLTTRSYCFILKSNRDFSGSRVKSLFRRRTREGGWLAISVEPDAVLFAHGVAEAPARCKVTRCGARPLGAAQADMQRVARELEADRYQCLTLLGPDQYQLLLVEAPNVPAAELKAAVRWRLKDMLDYHVDDATVDVLDIPPDPSGAQRAHSMYAVAARNDVVQQCIGRLESAGVPLTVIDIAETAQRNIAALFESPDRALAFLYFGADHSLLTINYHAELYLARRIEVTARQLALDEPRERVLLELQRSFDHFERQFPFASVEKLMVGPEPSDTGMVAYLSANLGLPVQAARLEEVLDVAGGLGEDHGWRLFHVLGASLRADSKAL
ncbi:MAG TPA: agglutinin biogenesis protein MshI [Burkholderiales bacterium]|nr:agglutinin biogenesis protein MshI [Burkholderiales bacterium]